LLYFFEDCVLDTDRRELRRAAAIVPVEPQVFDVLTYLIQNRERVVTRDDLLASVWEGRIVSESTLSSRINAARVAVGDSGDEQRLIRTVLRRGFRFAGEVREEHRQSPDERAAVSSSPSPDPAAPSSDRVAAAVPTETRGTRLVPIEAVPDNRPIPAGGDQDEPVPVTYRPELPSRTRAARYVGAGIAGAVVVLLSALLVWRSGDVVPQASSAQKFDPAVIPLVSDAHRRALANYVGRPDAKALAIAYDATAVVDGESSIESARQAALRQCQAKTQKTQKTCRIYAAGNEVVWSRETVPMPAPSDLRSAPLSIPLVPGDVPLLRGPIARRNITEQYMKLPPHKALAIATDGVHFTTERRNQPEAARMAVEGCAETYQRPCLVVSIDGLLTIEIPKTRKIERIFLPSIEIEIPHPQRERIAEIYRGADWRAVATGRDGKWEAIAGAASEAEAIDTVLKACARIDSECRLHAISNFYVARE
jgi:DNA-binding winged helix-turn-helix (wHTH) protein